MLRWFLVDLLNYYITRIHTKMIKNTGLVNIFGTMGEYFKESGETAKEMEKVVYFIQMEAKSQVFGKMIKESNKFRLRNNSPR